MLQVDGNLAQPLFSLPESGPQVTGTGRRLGQRDFLSLNLFSMKLIKCEPNRAQGVNELKNEANSMGKTENPCEPLDPASPEAIIPGLSMRP